VDSLPINKDTLPITLLGYFLYLLVLVLGIGGTTLQVLCTFKEERILTFRVR
jgi:hypothetical protein